MIFIRIDKTIVEQARSTDMLAFLENRYGFTFAQRGGVYRCCQHQSLVVKDDKLSWYWHSKGIGGYGALDYLMKIESLAFRQAVEAVEDVPAGIPVYQEPQPDKPLVLSEKIGILQSRLANYLSKQRGIDAQIVSALLDDGSIYEDRRGNVVFVGFDEQKKPKFASLRGTYGDKQFRMDCAGSDKRYGFHVTYSQSERLYIFESPIDAMSHASLENIYASSQDAWWQDNRLSLAGIADTALPKYLETHPHIKELVLCLDSDLPGREAAVAICRKYTDNGYYTRMELPQHKDYNEDLLENIELQKTRKNAVKLHKETEI